MLMVKWPYPPLHLHSGRRSVPASRALASPLLPAPPHLPAPPLLDFLPIFPETSIAFHLQALTHRVSLELATSKKSTAIFVCSIIYNHHCMTLSFPCYGGLVGFLLLILMHRASLFGLLHNFWMEETNTNGGSGGGKCKRCQNCFCREIQSKGRH